MHSVTGETWLVFSCRSVSYDSLNCHSMNLYKTFLLQQCKSYYFLYSYILPNFIFSRFQHLTLQNNLIWDVFIGSLISKPKVRNQPENLNSVTERGITCDYMKEILKILIWNTWFGTCGNSVKVAHKISSEILTIFNCAKSENSKLIEMSFFLIWVPDYQN